MRWSPRFADRDSNPFEKCTPGRYHCLDSLNSVPSPPLRAAVCRLSGQVWLSPPRKHPKIQFWASCQLGLQRLIDIRSVELVRFKEKWGPVLKIQIPRRRALGEHCSLWKTANHAIAISSHHPRVESNRAIQAIRIMITAVISQKLSKITQKSAWNPWSW